MKIAIGRVRVGKRVRSLRDRDVALLMESIADLGLMTPITVASSAEKREGGGQDVVCYDLIAGQHRLEACRRLGWVDIEADIRLMTPAQQRLWEIDENLRRADLTELERDEHLYLRKDAYEAAHPEAKTGVAQALGMHRALGHNVAAELATTFASDTTEKTGVAERTVQRAVRRVKNIDPKVRDRIRDNPAIADSGSELDALAGMPAEEQKRAVAMVEAGAAESIRNAKKLMDKKAPPVAPLFKEAEKARQKRRAAFTKAWNALDEEDRDWARAEIDPAVADNTSALRATA